jgi:arylsulfatase A-like enzyme
MRRRIGIVALVLLGVVVGLGAAALLLRRSQDGPTLPSLPTPAGAPNILVLAPDTLRADRVDARITPNIDRLAARGTRFTQAFSQSGWTLPALSALLSGRFPLAFEQASGQALDFMRADLATLPESLRASGYHTAVFWGASISGAAPEFSRGFDHVDRTPTTSYDAEVTAWIADPAHRPFFVVVHNIDLQFTAAYPGRSIDPLYQEQSRSQDHARVAASLVQAYEATVSAYDAAIGRIVAALDTDGLTTSTVVVVTSNHGLNLGEHGNFDHGMLYDTNLHVPLVVADPSAPQGRTVDTVVQTVDLAPTLLDRAGVKSDTPFAGRSLLPLTGARAGTYEAREVYSMVSVGAVSIRTPEWKVIRLQRRGDATAKLQVFDLLHDPGEGNEIHGNTPPNARPLVDRLGKWWSDREAEAAAARHAGGVLERLEEALRANGYWKLVAP